jgi:hypothetical protein
MDNTFTEEEKQQMNSEIEKVKSNRKSFYKQPIYWIIIVGIIIFCLIRGL